MTVAELVAALSQHPADMPVSLMWSHGAEPGPVTEVRLVSYNGSTPRLEIRGEQPDV